MEIVETYSHILLFIDGLEQHKGDIMDNNEELMELYSKLTYSDYQVIKYVEGELTEEEFTPIKAQRKQWRERVRQLEKELGEKK